MTALALPPRFLALLVAAIALAADCPAGAQELPTTLTYTLKSGNADVGSPALSVWVQGASLPELGFVAADLPLEHPFVVSPAANWASVSGASWVSPFPTAAAAPEGYEYFSLFALPPAFKSATLDVVWRADDIGEVAVNGYRLAAPRASFAASGAAGQFHGDITPYLTIGMNRLQFFVGNARVGVNATGVSFVATITLARAFASQYVPVTVAGLSAGPFDPQRMSVWHFQRENPILQPQGVLEMQAGEGNIYAPDVHKIGDVWLMFYGGQGLDGHDRIFRADSSDGIHWIRAQHGQPIIDVAREGGGANHVNDPTAVWVNDLLEIFYTRAPVGEVDRIDRFVNGQVDYSIIPLGAPGTWDSYKVGRPSVLFEDGVYKMWYDGTASFPNNATSENLAAGRHVGYATSPDGVHWAKASQNPVVRNSGAVDVKHIGPWYVLVQESADGTQWALGSSETTFVPEGLLIPISGERYDRFGHVTPDLYMEGDRLVAVYFGAAQGKDGDPAVNWNRNRIAVAFLQKEIRLRAADGRIVPIDVLAIDADHAEVRIPDTLNGQIVYLDVLAEDGKSLLSSSDVITLKPGLGFQFDGHRILGAP